MPKISPKTVQMEKLRQKLWPDDDPWTGKEEVGWVKMPRTFPLILRLLDSKELSGAQNLSNTYLELWGRQSEAGVIEISQELDHVYASGYSSNRVRSWRERMALLEELGFIKSQPASGQQYKYVLLIHPTIAVQKLRDQGRIDNEWWTTYVARQTTTKEASYQERTAKRSGKLVEIKSAENTASDDLKAVS
jgi:hypothetical protein